MVTEVCFVIPSDIVNGQCSSELSGPSSWGWMSDGPALVMDGTAKTFREMADHLLTPREKSALRQALLDYKANRWGAGEGWAGGGGKEGWGEGAGE